MYSLARHIAQSKDNLHKSWRIKNNITPSDTETMRDIPKMVKQIEPLIDDWQLFYVRDVMSFTSYKEKDAKNYDRNR